MTCLRRIGFALLAGCLLASPVQGQFPWSKRNAAAEGEHRTGSIPWRTDVAAGMKEAREKRKLVFLHFSGKNCPPCRTFEEKVLQRNDVAVALLARYVPIYIVVENSPDLVEQYQVRGWPTDVLLDSDGREIARQISPQDPREFIKRISTIANKHQAGQFATIANVRAAVAADVLEPNPQVQQTSGDSEQKPQETPRPSTKVVSNPYAKESKLPPIVSRERDRTPPVADEEEGFSPPNARRRPPIVKKSRPAETAVASRLEKTRLPDKLDTPVEEFTEEATEEAAPWRRKRAAKLLAESEERAALDEPPRLKEVADAKLPPVKKSATRVEGAEEANDEEMPAPDAAAEEASTPSSTDAPSSDAKASEGRSRFSGSTGDPSEEVEEEKAEPPSEFTELVEETPAEDEPAEEMAESPEEATEETEASEASIDSTKPDAPEAESEETSSETSAEESPAEHPADPVDVEESKEEAPVASDSPKKKSRFSEEDESEESPAEETPVEETAPSAEEEATSETPEDEANSEPETEKAESDAEDNEDEAAMPAEEPAAEEKQEVEKETPAEEEEADEEEEPVAKPNAKTAKASKPREEVSAEGKEKKREFARVAKAGKYVLDGHCCVTLLEKEVLVKGNPKIGAIHRGRIYLFCTVEAREKFLQNPDDYSPMLSGYDPVIYTETGELIDGSPKILAGLEGGRVVAFANEETYKRFAADYKVNLNKSVYVQTVRTAMIETNGGRYFR